MIRKMLTDDYTAKIISVILALIVWVQVFNDKNPLERRVLAVDVVPENVPQEILIVSSDPPKVNVVLEGRARTLDEIDEERLKAVADLSEAQEGTFSAELSVDAPYGVKIVEISPQTAGFHVDVMSSANVDVAIETLGTPHEDFERGDPIPSAGTVRVTGPKRLVERVKYVQGSVDVSGAREAITQLVKLSARDSAGNEVPGVSLEPNQVHVTVPLNSLPPSKIVPVQAVVAGTPKTGFAVGPVSASPAQVKIRAPEPVLRNIGHISTKPIDVTGKDSTFLHQATLDLPQGVTVQDGRVLITVEIVEDITTETYEGVIVQLESPPVGYAWEIDPAIVNVNITGRSDILDKIAKDDITVYIDAYGRTEGTADLVVAYRIKAPEGTDPDMLQVDIKPARVKLTLTKR
ncbi:MAG: YbbR-like domain-containing protein [Bacillota bacterium]|jgi:YbbR domain-containing protein